MMSIDSINTFMDNTILPSMGITSCMEGYDGIKSQLTNLFSNIILYIKEYAEVDINGCMVHQCLGSESVTLGKVAGSVYAPVPLKIK